VIIFCKRGNGKSKAEENYPVETRHPVDRCSWLSFATFSWISGFMFSSYRNGLKESEIPHISWREKCRKNTDALEEIWTRERAFSDSPDLGRVLWIYCRKRVFLTTIIYLTSIFLGFIGPVTTNFRFNFFIGVYVQTFD